MGGLTRTEIIDQGLANTGRDDLASLIVPEFKAWLRQKAGEWNWPRLFRREEAVALSAGSRSLSFGNGAIVTPQVQRIIDPIWVYKSDYTQGSQLRIQTITDTPAAFDESINDPVRKRARPERAKVRPDATLEGKWVIWFSSVPDQAYLLALDYIVMPTDPGATDKPWYPNDMTMIKLIECIALKYAKRYDVLAQEREILRSMTVEDRGQYGQIPGTNESLPLDSGIFR